MTTLNKLGIQGIRSFSSERIEAIEFEKPVTLIVGHNGAGTRARRSLTSHGVRHVEMVNHHAN